jgi:hypothetical protein
MLYAMLAIAFSMFLSGYVLGRLHRREAAQEVLETKKVTFLVRPHTERTLQEYPLPEEAEPGDVVDVQWGSRNLPNSGVRWQ